MQLLPLSFPSLLSTGNLYPITFIIISYLTLHVGLLNIAFGFIYLKNAGMAIINSAKIGVIS